MTSAARQAAYRVLDRHSALVRSLPVPILQMAEADGWGMQHEPLDRLDGIAVVLPPIKRMIVNSNLQRPAWRGVVGHEMGHHERDDMTSIQFSPIHLVNPFGMWLHDRAERGAWEIAAHILVPLDLLSDYMDATIDEIARACDVTPELVQLVWEGM